MNKFLKTILLIFSLIGIFFIINYKYNNINHSKNVFKDISQNEEVKYIALTFDDGPHPKYTNILLDGLKERNVKVTFFVLGINAEKNYNVIKRMDEEGHLIGNHTYSHKNLYRLKNETILDEIDKTNRIIEAITQQSPKYFRPSYGNYNTRIKNLTNMEITLWNIDSLDWKIKNSKRITNRVLSKVSDGSIILMHDIYKTSIKAALDIIDKLQEEGYKFVTIDELMEKS